MLPEMGVLFFHHGEEGIRKFKEEFPRLAAGSGHGSFRHPGDLSGSGGFRSRFPTLIVSYYGIQQVAKFYAALHAANLGLTAICLFSIIRKKSLKRAISTLHPAVCAHQFRRFQDRLKLQPKTAILLGLGSRYFEGVSAHGVFRHHPEP
jgi:hypothetical protein